MHILFVLEVGIIKRHKVSLLLNIGSFVLTSIVLDFRAFVHTFGNVYYIRQVSKFVKCTMSARGPPNVRCWMGWVVKTAEITIRLNANSFKMVKATQSIKLY